MHITFSPVRMDDHLTLSRTGDTLTVNGEPFDLSGIPEGATLPPEAIDSDWFCGPVERTAGVLHVTLRLPHGAPAPEATRFPAPMILTGNGPVVLPVYEVSE